MLPEQWSSLSAATRRLLATRFWRSIGQGTLVVDLALFLHASGWRGSEIGIVLAAGGLAGALLNLLVGATSDRCRRKPFLIAYEILTCACALVCIVASKPALLCVAIILGGFGRGGNGAAGPFAPAEQAWLAEAVKPELRGKVYSLNTAGGCFGMTIGALAAALPPLLTPLLGSAGSYRPLFGLVLIGNAINIFLLMETPEMHPSYARQSKETRRSRLARREENGFLWRLVGLNAFNGLAIGLTSPLMAYWFAQRFHVGPSAIGPVMALTFIISGFASLLIGGLTERIGLVRAVVWGRSAGVALLFILPLMPMYYLASLVFLLRSALNRGTIGARQALVISSVRDERRGFAASLNSLSMQLPRSLGPAAAGALIEAGWLASPFFFAALLQGIYIVFYGRLFAPYERRIISETERN